MQSAYDYDYRRLRGNAAHRRSRVAVDDDDDDVDVSHVRGCAINVSRRAAAAVLMPALMLRLAYTSERTRHDRLCASRTGAAPSEHAVGIPHLCACVCVCVTVRAGEVM